MNTFLSLHYWLNLRPGELASWGLKYFCIFILILAIFTFIFALLKARGQRGLYGRIWQRMFSLCLTNLIIGLLLLFFIYEEVPFLSTRLWFVVWGLSLVVWLFFICRALIKIPKIKEEIRKEKEFKKYIP